MSGVIAFFVVCFLIFVAGSLHIKHARKKMLRAINKFYLDSTDVKEISFKWWFTDDYGNPLPTVHLEMVTFCEKQNEVMVAKADGILLYNCFQDVSYSQHEGSAYLNIIRAERLQTQQARLNL